MTTHPFTSVRRSAGALAALGLVTAGVAGVSGSPTAQAAQATQAAAPVSITDAEFRWDLNAESTSGAYAPGTWNLFSAGRLANPGAGGQTLTSSDQGTTWSNGAAAGWKNSDGNVTVQDRAADGTYAPTTWQGTRTNTAGETVNTSGTTSDNVVSVKGGTGTLDPDTDSGTIAWDGDFTVVYYSGMSYFHITDPTLTLTNGAGAITATLGGYASSMEDTSQWQALPETQVTLADLSGVDITAQGLSTTPAYRGVRITPPAGSSAQVTSGDTAGSFPQSFVDFQGQVGGASYWYSSGGAADARKPASVVHVLVGGVAPPPVEPTDQPTQTAGQAKGTAKARWLRKPSARKAGRLALTAHPQASGQARAVVRTAKGRKVGADSSRIRAGKARLSLPVLSPGVYRLKVVVPRNDDVTRATTTKRFRVR